ncbi:MAG: SCO family protein [Verrucomicrobia bacterium]|nr:SCO family protein [Verrucomicrobiota bacterium]
MVRLAGWAVDASISGTGASDPPMNPLEKQMQRWIWGGLILGVVALAALAMVVQTRKSPLPVLSEIRPFALTNQLGQAVGPRDLTSQVCVANVVFSRCPTQCHRLSRQMAELQKRIPEGVRLISLTADPSFDSPDVLRHYAERYGADAERWWFLTGAKSEVYRFAEKDLLFSVMDTGDANPRLEDRFIHSGTFVILDRKARMRAVVQSEEQDALDRIVTVVNQLKRERTP